MKILEKIIENLSLKHIPNIVLLFLLDIFVIYKKIEIYNLFKWIPNEIIQIVNELGNIMYGKYSLCIYIIIFIIYVSRYFLSYDVPFLKSWTYTNEKEEKIKVEYNFGFFIQTIFEIVLMIISKYWVFYLTFIIITNDLNEVNVLIEYKKKYMVIYIIIIVLALIIKWSSREMKIIKNFKTISEVINENIKDRK